MTGQQQDPVLTAVVFGYRNEETILRAVRSLLEQETDEPFEVVVASSGGDGTGDLVRARYPEVRVAEWPTRLYPGGVRNLGIRMAQGEIVAFLEADCVACPNWVSSRIALHRAGHGAVASAVASDVAHGRAAQAWLYLVHPSRLVGHPPGPASSHQAYGLSFTREVLDQAGPFDETLRTDEDSLMAERLAMLGIQPWFDPAVCLDHLGPLGMRTFLRDQYSRGRLDSWEETLRLPAGRLRRRFEPSGWACPPFVVLRALQRLSKRVRWIAVEWHRARPGPYRELIVLAVPMALGQLSYQAGWIVDQVRVVRRSKTERRGDLPVPFGLRRRVATTGEAVVALTFAGGPSDETVATLDVLDELGVPAAFFVTGEQARRRPAVVRQIAAAGHLVGTNGGSGRPFTDMDDEELERDVKESLDVIRTITGATPRHVQIPHGAYDQRVVSVLQSLGLEMWLWTVHPHDDASNSSAPDIVARVTDDLTPGSVILLHDAGSPQGFEALPDIVAMARQRRFRFVALDFANASVPRTGAPAETAEADSALAV
jgi:peptidoglycan/xylan/chitin deacetylase (PgdA/CDA1 family)